MRRLTLAALALAWIPPLAGQAPAPSVITELPPSTRSAAMAGTGVALIGDAGSVFVNPSGLATIKVLSLEGAFAPLPDGSTFWQAAGAFRVRQFNLGGGAAYLLLPDSSRYANNVTWVGSADYRYGLLSIGATARYVSVTDTAGEVNRTFTTDFGMTAAVFDIMSLAFSMQGIGNQELSGLGVAIPRTTHLGYMLNLVDPQGTGRFLATIEWVWTESRDSRFLVGVEGGAVLKGVGLLARAGYGPPAVVQEGGRWTVGGGVVLGRLGLDYSYQQVTFFGADVHSFGLRFTP